MRVKIRGYRDPFQCTKEDEVKLEQIATDETVNDDDIVRLSFGEFRVDQIENKVFDRENAGDSKALEEIRKQEERAIELYRTLSTQSYQERAKRGISMLTTILRPSNVVVTPAAKDRLTEWFEAHPYRTVADWDIMKELFHELVPSISVVAGQNKEKPLVVPLTAATMRIYGLMLSHDLRMFDTYHPNEAQAKETRKLFDSEEITLDPEDEEKFRKARAAVEADREDDNGVSIDDIPF